jgi:hypothetical protein
MFAGSFLLRRAEMKQFHENVDPAVAEEIQELQLEGVEVIGTIVTVSDDAGAEHQAAIATVLRQDPESRFHLE